MGYEESADCGVLKDENENHAGIGGIIGGFGDGGTYKYSRGPGCFNCGHQGHKSKECTRPRRPRDYMPSNDYVPVDLPIQELYKMRIGGGPRFDEIFEADVDVTMEGKKSKITPIKKFDDFHLPHTMKKNLEDAHYKKPTPVQQYAMSVIRDKQDLMACAQTGTGKTAAFLVPIIKNLLDEGDFGTVEDRKAYPRCVIVAPTRELAEQISNEGKKLVRGTNLKIDPVFGGMKKKIVNAILAEGPTIIVGTMGCLLNLIQAKLVMYEIRYIVLDEADRMLERKGFAKHVQKLLESCPSKEKRTMLMFSATFPEEVQELATQQLKSDHVMVSVNKIGSANPCIQQDFVEVTNESPRMPGLLKLLNIDPETNKLIDESLPQKKTLIFVNGKVFADALVETLSAAGLVVVSMHSNLSQKMRHYALEAFRSGETPILIVTAVAERGLDIEGVDHVINYHLPLRKFDHVIERYVQRIGRTGRIGNTGRATSFFDASDEDDRRLAPQLVRVLSDAHQPVPDFLLNPKKRVGLLADGSGALTGDANGIDSAAVVANEW